MTSGSLFELILYKIYFKYRFKGIVLFTSEFRVNGLKEKFKHYSRITKITSVDSEAFETLHLLVHNTLFRGACKFKDLDHFLGKKHPINYYFLDFS